MHEDSLFRLILLAGFAVVFPTAAYYRIRAHLPNEKLDRRQEGRLILTTLRPLGLLGLAGVLVGAC